MTRSSRIKDIAALTPMQRGMLHDALLDPASPAHHEQLVLALEGPLDAARLEAAWQQVVDRHDALRGRFVGQRVSSPVQLVPQHEPIALQRCAIDRPDARSGPDGLPAELEEALQADRAHPFALESEHAMRLVLFSAGAGRHWLLWSFHHILLDGWSIGLVLDEVLAACGGAALPPPVDLTPWRRWLAARDTEAALGFWQQHLAGFRSEGLAGADLAAAPHARAAARLDAASTQRLRALAQARQATLHHVLLCAWALTLGRYGDQQDVLVPTVLAGRPAELPDADAMVGLFIHTVPMRVQWQGEDSFETLLQRVQQAGLAAAGHQVLSLADIQARTGPLPIDHVFLAQGLPGEAVVGRRCGDARVAAACFREAIPYPLQVSVTPEPDGIAIVLQGRREAGGLQSLADAMVSLLAAVAAQPARPLREHDALAAAHRATVLAWGDGGPAASRGTLLEALAGPLAHTPEAPALVCGDERLSYRALHARANRLAHALLAEGPLAPDTPVALIARRDANLVAGLLAILKAGGAYLPIDPEHPRQRAGQMLEAAGCRHVLLAPGLEHVLPVGCTARVLPLALDAGRPETPPEGQVRPGQLAYVIFTSGSTGTPKGVMLTHANAASVLAAIPAAAGFEGPQRVLGATTVSFDISILELLGPLTWGGTLVLADAEQARDPSRLLDLVEREEVTVLQATPSRLRLLLASGPDAARGRAVLGRLRHVLVGGEALPASLARELLALAPLRACNMYGPTETAIWSACWPLAPGPVRLGRALAGEQLLVLSHEGSLQPPGAVGEIAIAGAGVARGYLGDPERTAARFVRVPGIPGPVYRTGDLGRWCADGGLEFRGRRDEQVKVRGMRIELAELERHLQQLPGVRAAAAAVRAGPQGDELVAWLVGPAAVDPQAVRAVLAESLPAAMLPARFVLLDALPLTPAGKTDRRALPAPQAAAGAAAAMRPPASEREARICAVFAEVLGQPVGPDDDFFLCGGHSLLAIQAVGRINRALGGGYALRDLYRAATPAALAALVAAPDLPLRAEPPAADHPLSAQQQALWVLQQLQPDYAGYNVPGAYLVTGPLDLDLLARAWAAVVARHAVLRTVFVPVDGLPRQQVLPRMDFAIERHALPPGADPEATVREITCRPFDLERGPLFRLARIALDGTRQLLLLVLHHIVSDGWSDALLAADLEQAWRAVRRGGDPLSALGRPPAIGYTDYARWQQRYLASPAARAHADFWRARLADLPQLAWPAAGARSAALERPGARVALRLEADEAAEWLAACPARERHAALAAATLALLHAETGQHDLVLALPVANRDRPQLQEQPGLHLNLLPLRLRIAPDATPRQLQRQCAEGIVEAMAHAAYPFARLVEDLGLAAAPGRHPVSDAMLIFHQQPTPLPRLEGLQVALHEGRSYRSRFDLDVEVWAAAGAVHGFIEYDAALFTPQQAQGFAARWQALLLAACRAPEAPLAPGGPGRSPASDAQRFLRRALAVDEEF